MKLKVKAFLFYLPALLLFASFSAGAAEYVYFAANAFDWSGAQYFDYAMVGVAKNGQLKWGGEGGNEQVYLTICSTPGSDAGSADYAASDAARYSALGWADLTAYVGSEYLFYIETYENDGDEPVMQCFENEAQSYAELKADGHIFNSSSTDWQDVTPWTVPEPASGILALLGAGLVAWRRRRRRRDLLKIDKADKIDSGD